MSLEIEIENAENNLGGTVTVDAKRFLDLVDVTILANMILSTIDEENAEAFGATLQLLGDKLQEFASENAEKDIIVP